MLIASELLTDYISIVIILDEHNITHASVNKVVSNIIDKDKLSSGSLCLKARWFQPGDWAQSNHSLEFSDNISQTFASVLSYLSALALLSESLKG